MPFEAPVTIITLDMLVQERMAIYIAIVEGAIGHFAALSSRLVSDLDAAVNDRSSEAASEEPGKVPGSCCTALMAGLAE